MIISLFVYLPLCIYAQVQVEIGRTYTNFIGPWMSQNHNSYDLQLTNLIQGEDLVFMVKSLFPQGDPNLYVSLKNSEPIQPQDAEILRCDSKGIDICVIEHGKVQNNVPYHITVICEGFCRYAFKVNYEKEYQMIADGDILLFSMKEDEDTEIITITAENSQIKDDTQLEIFIKVLNLYELEEPFRSYLSINDYPTTSSHYLEGKDSFSGTQIMKINAPQLNNKDIYRLLVQAQNGAQIEISTKLNHGNRRQIFIYEDVEDIIGIDETLIYELSTDGIIDSTFNFQLQCYSGAAKMYVNPDKELAFLDLYKWKGQNQITQDLIITRQELVDLKASGEKFYIAIYGLEKLSAFSFRSSAILNSQMQLELNKPIFGKLSKQELINYKFTIRHTQSVEVSIQLTNLEGNSDMVVKYCKAASNCTITQEEIQQRKSLFNTKPDKLFLYSDNDGTNFLKFTTDPTSNCIRYKNEYTCQYVVGLHARSTGNTNSQYSLLASIPESTISLIENTPHKHFIEKGNSNYYKFIVHEGDDIQRLTFVLNPIQGQPTMMTSMTNHKPNITHCDQKASQNLIAYGWRSNFPVEIGVYYIGIFGDTASLYTITVSAIRNRADFAQIGKFDWHYTQIFQGQAHRYTSIGNSVLLKVDLTTVDVRLTDFNPIIINIEIEKGNVTIFGFDHPEVNNELAKWKGNTNLEIRNDFPQLLYIKLVPINPQAENIFKVAYRAGAHISDQQLFIGENYYNYIEENKPQLFRLLFINKEDITITKHSSRFDQSKLRLRVMIQGDQIQITDQSSITIKGYQLPTDTCAKPTDTYFQCTLVLQLEAKESTFFNLYAVSGSSDDKFLVNGETLVRPVPESEHHYNFIPEVSDTEIMVHCQKGNLEILAIVYKKETTIHERKYPTASTAQYISLSRKYNLESSLLIPKGALEGCETGECQVLLTIRPAEISLGEYTIYYTSQVLIISESIQYTGQVPQQGFKFFSFHHPDINQGLMIIVTPLSAGDPDIYVSKDKLPTLSDYDWISQQYLGDQLIIQPHNIRSNDLSGVLYIGVYSQTNTDFTIQVKVGNFNLFQLYRGMPFNMRFQRGSTIYFHYYHVDNQPFKVLYHSNFDTHLSYYLEPYKNEAQINDLMQKNIKDFKIKVESEYLEYFNDRQEHYCHQCHYLIAFKPKLDLDLSITIMVKDQFMYLPNNYIQVVGLAKDETHNYHFFLKNEFTAFLTLFSGQIKVYGELSENLTNINNHDWNSEIIQINYVVNKTVSLKDVPHKKSEYYTIKVVGLEESKYQLQCVETTTIQEIKVGQPVQINALGNSSSLLYQFTSQNQLPDSRFSITLEQIIYQDNYQSELIFPYVEVTMALPNSKRDEKEAVRIYSKEEAKNSKVRYLEFEDLPGTYYIKIHNQGQLPLNFNMVIGTASLNTLYSEQERVVSSLVGKRMKWDIYLRAPAQIYLSLAMCGGVVNVEGSNNSTNILSGGYDQQIKNIHNKQISGVFTSDKGGMYYISTMLTKLNNISAERATYSIRPTVLAYDTFIPNKEIGPRLEGQLFWELKKLENEMELIIDVPLIEYNVSNLYQVEYVNYFLISEIRPMNDNTPFDECQLNEQRDYKRLTHEKHLALKSYKLSKKFNPNELNNLKLLFNVLAKVYVKTNNTESLVLDYYYKEDRIYGAHVRQAKLKHYFGYILLVAILIGGSVIVYLYKKNKQLERSLKYEACDIKRQNLVSESQQQDIEMHYREHKEQ